MYGAEGYLCPPRLVSGGKAGKGLWPGIAPVQNKKNWEGTEEYFAFYRTLNRVYSISIDLIIFNNYIGAQSTHVTDEVIFLQVTDPGLIGAGLIIPNASLQLDTLVYAGVFSGISRPDRASDNYIRMHKSTTR